MPGGHLEIAISNDFFVLMRGPVTKVAEGTISHEIFGQAIWKTGNPVGS
jgi:hypothetical protein